jgi:CHAT domain-containing protein
MLSLGLVVGGTVLPSEEIVRLHIPVEVAVVADCYTADNPTRSARKELDLAGDEVNHIANAFLCAGAQRVLGALWWTADEEVRYITDRFYEHYLAEGDATYALTEAIRSAISENIAPFYWASLMMFGKP